MNFLIDMPVSPAIVEWLGSQGHKAAHVSRMRMASASDIEIIRFAKRENSVIVTADLDFPRLIALARDDSPALIIFRGGNYKEEEMKKLLERVLQAVSPEDIKKSIVVVDKTRIRRITLPIY